jgi:hypothetical protein
MEEDLGEDVNDHSTTKKFSSFMPTANAASSQARCDFRMPSFLCLFDSANRKFPGVQQKTSQAPSLDPARS